MANTNKILPNSAGCRLKGPSTSHRFPPERRIDDAVEILVEEFPGAGLQSPLRRHRVRQLTGRSVGRSLPLLSLPQAGGRSHFDSHRPVGDCYLDPSRTGASESEFCEKCQGIGSIMETQSGQGVFIQSSTTCPDCRGRGSRTIKTCDECGGRGRVEVRDREIKFKVEDGMRDGYQIRIQGKGGKGLNGGPDGDLVAILHIIHPSKEDLTEEQIKVLEEFG